MTPSTTLTGADFEVGQKVEFAANRVWYPGVVTKATKTTVTVSYLKGSGQFYSQTVNPSQPFSAGGALGHLPSRVRRVTVSPHLRAVAREEEKVTLTPEQRDRFMQALADGASEADAYATAFEDDGAAILGAAIEAKMVAAAKKAGPAKAAVQRAVKKAIDAGAPVITEKAGPTTIPVIGKLKGKVSGQPVTPKVASLAGALTDTLDRLAGGQVAGIDTLREAATSGSEAVAAGLSAPLLCGVCYHPMTAAQEKAFVNGRNPGHKVQGWSSHKITLATDPFEAKKAAKRTGADRLLHMDEARDARKAAAATKKAAKATPATNSATKVVARTDPAFVTATNVAGFPIGAAEPNQERIGLPVPGHDGYFVRYARGAYDLAARIGDVDGPAWLALCRHGASASSEKLMGEGGVEPLAAQRKTWCADCAAGTPAGEVAPAPEKAQTTKAARSAKSTPPAAAPVARGGARANVAPASSGGLAAYNALTPEQKARYAEAKAGGATTAEAHAIVAAGPAKAKSSRTGRKGGAK